ncbi:MAG: hypothetical protein HZB55_18425 [Deltaproteobacteria bacterium]|nr:hypothetical protein [Deltaproteobacteria bacterium]
MRTTAGHELIHVLSDQHYTTLGAAMNRWFFEAAANLWSVRASGLDRAAAVSYYSKEMSTYLRSPLDASEEGSYYAAADFLDWAQQKTGRPLAADVMLADWTWDVSALNAQLTADEKTLGTYFTDYVLESTLGSHDLKPGYLWTNKALTSAAHGWRHEFRQFHLSAQAVEIRTDVPVDGLLVATSGRNIQDIKLKTYSYADPASPLTALDTNLEPQTAPGKPVVVKHFGKAGTPGVTSSVFRQVVVNPEASDATVWALYLFDYYLLEPPQEQLPRAAGSVAWTFHGEGMPSLASGGAVVKGFNVYLGGLKINTSPLSSVARTFSDARILADSDVTVTVVDVSGNEWPEVLPKGLPTTCSASVEAATWTFTRWNLPYNVENFGYPLSYLDTGGSWGVGVIAASGAYSGSSYSSARNIDDESDTTTGTLTFQFNATGTEITQFSTSEKKVGHHNGNFGGGSEVEIAGGGLPVSLAGGSLTAEVRGEAACAALTKLVYREYWEDWFLHGELQGYSCDATSVVRVTCE